MKNLLFVVLLISSLSTIAQEEKKGKRIEGKKLTTEQKVDLQVKKMTKELALNDKQAAQIRDIVSKEVAEREAKKASLKEERMQKRAELKEERTQNQAELSKEMKKVLTPEQFTKWEKIREERKEKVKEKMMERKGKAEIQELDSDK